MSRSVLGDTLRGHPSHQKVTTPLGRPSILNLLSSNLIQANSIEEKTSEAIQSSEMLKAYFPFDVFLECKLARVLSVEEKTEFLRKMLGVAV